MYALAAAARPRPLPRPRPGDVRRDGAGRRSRSSASSTTSTTARAAVPTTTPTRWGTRDRRRGREAGIRLTLLDTCYLHGGIGEPPGEPQRRFADGDAEAWASARRRAAGRAGTLRVGAAIHSVRAVDPAGAALVAAWAADGGRPAARPRLRAAGRERGLPARRTARTPTALLADAGALTERFTAVHATHVDRRRRRAARRRRRDRLPVPDDRARPRRRHRAGRAPARRRARASRSAATRTRSSTSSRRRARSSSTSAWRPACAATIAPATCCDAATRGGYASLGWPEAGASRPGRSPTSSRSRLDSRPPGGRHRRPRRRRRRLRRRRAPTCATSSSAAGAIVRDGRHLRLDVAAELAGAIRAVAP